MPKILSLYGPQLPIRATATNNDPEIVSVDFENEWTSWSVDNEYTVYIEDSKTLKIKVTAVDEDECQELVFSLNDGVEDDLLPPVDFAYEQVGDEFNIIFNANCYTEDIPRERDLDSTERIGKVLSFICDCTWNLVIRVTDGCATDVVYISVCVGDIF